MEKIDHIAIQTTNISKSVDWYKSNFSCEVEHQDSSWALIRFSNISLAFVLPDQHPSHIAIERENLENFGTPVLHRDGSESVYINGPSKDTVELIRYPKS